MSAVKADKHQEQQRGPSPRSWTLSLKRETHWEPDQCRGAAFNSDAPAAGLCMPRAGNAQSWRWEFALPGSAHSSLPTGQLGEQNRHGHAENGEGAKAAVQRSHTHATTTERRGQKKRCVATKAESITRSPSHHSGRASKERKKKKPEDQKSLISCHQQRSALCPHPTAADETAQPAVPVARVRRGHRVAAEPRASH